MACPYAKKIRGTIAYCSLINKKVSTLRYPCKGNYKRCPIYIRYRARAAPAAPREQAPPQPPPQAPPAPAKTPPAPTAPARPPAPQPSRPQPQPAPSRGAVTVKPSKSLCDSLILAALITTARALDRYAGDTKGLVEELISRTQGKSLLLFFIGQSDGVSIRMLAHAGRVVYAFERGGSPVCGNDAEALYREVLTRRVDGIIYEIRWEDIPLWRETVQSEFS